MCELAIYDDPDLYDRIVQPGPCEWFYDNLALRMGGPVLELACGTGRLSLALASHGHAVVGLDNSSTMLDRARKKAADRKVDAIFLEYDMRCFELRRRFPLIIVTCNSLAHLANVADLVACLTCAADHLEENGLLAFDIVNPNLHRLGQAGVASEHDWLSSPSGLSFAEEWTSYDPINQVGELLLRISEPGLPERVMPPLRLRHFFPQEVPLLLQAAGLQMVDRYGDFAGNSLTAHSKNQICLAQHTSCATRYDVDAPG